MTLSRRRFLADAATIAAGGLLPAPARAGQRKSPAEATVALKPPVEPAGQRLPSNIPAGIAAVLAGLLRREPAQLNTDWDGTMPLEALLLWSRRGLAEGRALAERWFEHHLDHDPRLSDEEFCRTYSGPPARVIRSGPLPFTTYCGLYGLSFPCHELYVATADPRARQVCLAIADAILHLAGRETHGLVLHDDGRPGRKEASTFTIPDTLYFVVRA